jgi:SAM-dependent methyltransferase
MRTDAYIMLPMSTGNAATYKDAQRESWDALSNGWATWSADFESGAAAVTSRLLELSGARRGQNVLDLAAGAGDPALDFARAVEPGGAVLGVDISPAMVELARSRVATDGLGNVDFEVGDLQAVNRPDNMFEVVVSRFGLMLAPNRRDTFAEILRLLVTGGVLVFAVWGALESHQFSIAPRVLGDRLDLPPPPPNSPGPFSMSDPELLASELTAAGFAGVHIVEQTAPFHLASVERYVAMSRALLPPEVVRRADDTPGAWDAVGTAAAPYVHHDGSVHLPSLTYCVRAVRPASSAGYRD